MKHILAKPTITNDDVITFLDQTSRAAEKKLNEIDTNDPHYNVIIEDTDNLYATTKNIAEKIKNRESLEDEELSYLKILLTTIQKNIQRGIIEGTPDGIVKYLKSQK